MAEMGDFHCRSIEELLKDLMGLHVDNVGHAKIDLAVKRRMNALGIGNKQDYLRLLLTSRSERSELIEEVVVPETWLFRDTKPFEALVTYTKRTLSQRTTLSKIKLLSVPCSTGEEPYSMAISLVEAGIGTKNFSIDGIDISKKAINRAKEALFSERSFKECNPAIKERYFTRDGGQYRLKDSIRYCVNFRQGNVLERGYMLGLGKYDVIFCRNLLIYFDEKTRSRVISILRDILLEGGFFVVGQAEGGKMSDKGLSIAPFARGFGFIKEGSAPSRDKPPRGRHQSPSRSPRDSFRPFNTTKSCQKKCERILKDALAPVSKGEEKDILLEAKRLADRGDLESAAEQCEQFIEKNGPRADAYFLLGVIKDASGDSGYAKTALKKAIYLEPTHHEAMLFLSCILEREGDDQGASLLRQRANRILASEEGTK